MARLTTGIHGRTQSLAAVTVVRMAVVGTPKINSSAWRTACSRSSVAISTSGSRTPGRYDSLVWLPSISSAVSVLRAHSSVVWRGASKLATVVPHDPAPKTVTCMAER